MTANKSERLLNLLILLLVSRTYVSKDKIRDAVEEYRQQSSREAFEKMFERDKDELRALGIPVEHGSADAYFDDEHGYRVARDAFELPDLQLEPDEAAVVGLAARVWQHAGLASATSQALLKLKAAGIETDREVLDVVQPRLVADEPSFDALWQATQTRTEVSFDYRRASAMTPSPRRLQPWGMVSALGRWYVVGHDVDRGEPRLFRLSRVSGDVVAHGAPGSYAVPEGTDLRALTRELQRDRAVGTAVLRLRADAAHDLRRRASSIGPDPDPHDGTEGWDRAEVPFANLDQFAGEVLAALDAVEVLEPAELRDVVVARLEGVLA
ncbi:WYL domain-containing protein [Nocardioides mangrovicus]|uniref:WYL domain-containing protein n=1 Tax=Nocardioides mangrovicus TaxID=2478913 RepID=A0A3L8P181_9ACTN|nr:WYL domain-containing protein [Nocardioides mangrovicus]RLV48697.1 WYL domain-containing protein [Nocardioides mangrovicus]